MTPSRKAHHNSHRSPASLALACLTHVGPRGKTLQGALSHKCHICSLASQGGTSRGCSSNARLARSKSSSVPVCVALRVASWVHYREPRGEREQHTIQRSPRLPNNRSYLSDRCFLQSPEHFGRARQRLTLRLRPIVRCVQPRCISLVSEIGQATRSRQSFPKFSNDTRCATSV